MAFGDLVTAVNMDAEQEQRRDLDFALSFTSAFGANPDDEAKKVRLQQRTGVPAELMDEKVRRDAEFNDFMNRPEVHRLHTDAPGTARFLSKAQNAKLAHDDVQALSDVERVIRFGFGTKGPISALGIATPKDAAYAARQRQELKTTLEVLADPEQRADYFTGVKERLKGSTLRGVGGLSTMIGENMAQPLRDLMGYQEESGFLTGGRSLIQKGKEIGDQAAERYPVEPHSWLAAGSSALESIGQQVPMWLGAVLTKNPAAVVSGSMGGMAAGQSYADLRERGIAPRNAAMGAAGTGAVEVVTNKWGNGVLWDMMKPASKKSFVRLGNKMVELYGAELVGESAATFFQDVIDKVYTKPDMTPAEVRQVLTEYMESGEAWVNFIDTVKSTAIQTTLMGGAGVGVNRAGNAAQNRMERARVAKENAAVLNALGGIVKDSKTWQRLPGKVKELVQTHVDEHGAIEQVSIPVDYWQSGLESQGLDPAKVADDVLSDPAAYYEALETGGEVIIPLADYVAKVAPAEFHQVLVNDVRFSPGEMTAREAEEFEKGTDREAILQELAGANPGDDGTPAVDPVAESTGKVYDDVLGQLSGAFPRDTAQKYATLAAARARTRAERLGVDPWQMYQERPLEVVRGDAQGGATVLNQAGTDRADTPEFKSWFGESKVADEDGAPLVVYHGTKTPTFETFDEKKAGKGAGKQAAGAGFYFTNLNEAANLYTKDARTGDEKGAVMPVFLSLQNPFYSESWPLEQGATKKEAKAFTAKLKAEGYDGVIISHGAGVKEYVAFSPEQIKSAIGNRGTFDPDDPNILHQGGEENRGFIRLGGEKVEIGILEKADLSTFLHELGHSWLEELKVDAARESAPDQVKSDWDTIKAWLGVKGDTITTEQHEQFARGAEAYLMEGKAPSTELQQIFQRFAAWLKMIYRELRGLNVRLNDDVRKVFDRLLASDGEIELARKQQRLQPMFTTAAGMGVTEAEFKLYADQAAKAGQAARDSLFNTVLEDLRREQRKEWKERWKETRDEVEAGAKEMPVYRAWQVLTRGEDFDGSKPEVPLKLSREILVETYGEDFAKQLPRAFRRIYSAEGGFHPDDLAQIFGFQTGRQMLDALIGMQRMKDFVKAEADRRMHERYPDLFDDGRIVEEAMAAAMSEDMGKVMHIEAQAIVRQLEKTDKAIRARESESRKQKREAFGKVPHLEYFRLNAMLAIGRMPATRIDPRFYSRVTAKAGLEVEKALSKQDWETAAAAQIRRLTNLYLFREATKARQEVEKIGKHMRGLAAPAAQKRLGLASEVFQDQVNDILARFEFAVVPFKELQRREDLVAWAEKVNRESGMEPYIVRDIPESVTNYRQIPLEDLRAVFEMARSIEHVARATNQALQQLDKETMEEIRAELVEAADSAGKDLKQQVSEDLRTFWDKRRGEAERWDAENVTARTIINILDGGRQDGPWHRYLLHPASASLAEQLNLGEKVAVRMNDMLDSLDGSHLRDPIGTKYGALSRREVMSLALNLGNLSNIDKMVRGGFAAWQGKTGEVTPWQFEDVFEICQKLDRQDWQFVQEVWSLLDQELAPMVDRLQRQFTGLPLKKVEAQTINIRTADGHDMSLKGGYYPMVYDPRFANAQARSSDGYLAGLGDDFSRVTTPQGSTIERTGYAAPVLMDFTRVLSKHLHDNILDVTHRAFLYDTQRLLNHPAIRNILQTKLGDAYEKVLNDWLKIIAGDGSVDPARNMHFLDKMAEKARTNVTIVALGFKVTTMLAQPTAVFNAMEHPDVGAAGLLRGFKELSLEPGYIFGMGKTWAMITEKSSFMRHRSGAVDATIRDSLKRLDTKALRWKAMLAHASMVGVGWADRGTTAPTWLGAYRGALANGMTEEHAIQTADNAVVETHGSGNPMDLNVRQARRGVSKLFTMFMTPFVAAYQRIRQRGRDVNQKGIRYLPHAVLATLMVTALPAVIGDLITGRGPRECEPGDVKCYAKWALAKMLIAPAAITPESRIAGNFLEAKVVDGNKGADLRYSAVFSALEKMAKTATRDMDVILSDREFDKKLFLNNLESGAYLTGIPIGQGIITGSYLYDLMGGDERPQGPGEVMRNLMFRRVR